MSNNESPEVKESIEATDTAQQRTEHKKWSVGRKVALSVSALGLAIAVASGGLAVYNTNSSDSAANTAQEQLAEQLSSDGYEGTTNGEAGLSTDYDGKNKGSGGLTNDGYDGKNEGSAGLSPDDHDGKVRTGLAADIPSPSKVETGQAYGYIESDHFKRANLVEGDMDSAKKSQDLVDTGAAVHYEGQAQPGEVGNFSLSGHKTSHGAIFKNATNLKKGETVKVATSDGRFEYKVIEENKPVSVKEAEQMLTSDPFSKFKNTSKSYMTIQTCVGSWSWDREIIVLELVK